MMAKVNHPRFVVVAVNSSGTLGHLTSAMAIVETLLSQYKNAIAVTVVADREISHRFRDCHVIPVQRERDERSEGGGLHQSYAADLPDAILELAPDAVIFDTFFPINCIRALRETGIPAHIVSYRFRDTSMEIFLQQWWSYFTHCFWLVEPYELSSPGTDDAFTSRDVRLPPLALPEGKPRENNDECLVVVTRGGGGQSGTQTAFNRILEYLSQDSTISTVVVQGPFGSELKYTKNCTKVCVDMDRSAFLDLVRSASLVVSEAGYNTCVELATLGRKALLIPGPRRTDNQELRAVRMSRVPGFTYLLPEHADRISPDFIRTCLQSSEIIQPLDSPSPSGAHILRLALERRIRS